MIKNRKYKPLLIAVGIALLGLLLVKGLIAWNLSEYAYYYATHMPHAKNEYPIVRELDYCPLPDDINREFPNAHNQHTRSNFGGIDAENVLQKGDRLKISDMGLFYYPIEAYDAQYIVFHFDENYKIINHYTYDLKFSKSDRARILHVLDRLTLRLKKESPEPFINLQKIYNQRVKKRPNPGAYVSV
jgi:hypothetical protein